MRKRKGKRNNEKGKRKTMNHITDPSVCRAKLFDKNEAGIIY